MNTMTAIGYPPELTYKLIDGTLTKEDSIKLLDEANIPYTITELDNGHIEIKTRSVVDMCQDEIKVY